MQNTSGPKPHFEQYAHPERLVSTAWVEEHSHDDDVVIIESDEDVLLYETGHIPNAVKIDWHTELNDPVIRDYLSPDAFAELLSAKGIDESKTLVFYGDKSNWWAAYALWVFGLYGWQNSKLMDGGRAKWIAEGRELTRVVPQRPRTSVSTRGRDDTTIRAFRDDVLANLGKPLIDVRSPEEYTGERTTAPAYPEEGALRAGHIPTAANVPWGKAANEDGTFKSREELEQLYSDAGVAGGEDTIVYCRIGERSSHTWFVLRYLLGYDNVRNYDGSWTEWGSLVGVPIAVGSEPGEVPTQ